jgi:hypothetical protein
MKSDSGEWRIAVKRFPYHYSVRSSPYQISISHFGEEYPRKDAARPPEDRNQKKNATTWSPYWLC